MDPIRNNNPLQYSCLGNPMNRKASRAALQGVAKDLDMTEQLSTHKHSQEWLSDQEQETHGRLAGVMGS